MLSSLDEFGILNVSALSLEERTELVHGLTAVAYQASLSGAEMRGRLWRVVQIALPEKQELWNFLNETENLADLEREEEIDALYRRLEEDPADRAAFADLRRLQSAEAERLVQEFRESLPAKSGDLLNTLNEVRKWIDADTAQDDRT